jgi:hypothetical protein
MFPHPCGQELERAVAAGADPRFVVPDEYTVVKGGTTPLPEAGGVFSGAVGPTLATAACAVPHGQIRVSTAGAVRAAGGVVVWEPELSRHETVNLQHVNIMQAGPGVFSGLVPNPVPRHARIDGDQPNPRAGP